MFYAKDIENFIICDEIAMALALDQKIATASIEASCSVETTDALTRGQMVVNQPPSESHTTEVRLVTGVDVDRLVQLLTSALAD